MKIISNLIKNNCLNIEQRVKINNILYLSYEKWAIRQSLNFKKKHSYKCRNIRNDDLIISSKIGLFKSIKKYNGNSSFLYFSEIYIKGELLKTLTNYFSLSPLSKKIRASSKQNYSNDEITKYKKLLNTKLIHYSNNWQFDVIYNKKNTEQNVLKKIEDNELIENLWQKIDKLEPSIKRIFKYKYDYEFNVIRSNRYISELMGCSEENIRKKLVKTVNELKSI
jgi:RNA polymerase sigma factor (sigma-70 family)